MSFAEDEVIALVKPSLDAHTLGINVVKQLLEECGYHVEVADEQMAGVVNEIRSPVHQETFLDWIKSKQVTVIGISYRLDEERARSIVGTLFYLLRSHQLFSFQGGPIKRMAFGGLPKACRLVEEETNGFVQTFQGNETHKEMLQTFGVPIERIPEKLIESSKYDEQLMQFGESIVSKKDYLQWTSSKQLSYPTYGTKHDTLVERIDAATKQGTLPLTRAHVGPYSSEATREENMMEFLHWCQRLAEGKYLDILSIGSSQLSQSNFGEEWGSRPNGGGVPVNSEQEFDAIRTAASPMLVRTYSGTQRIKEMAAIYENHLNIAWHALSLWWFNRMDGRGPNDVYTNLVQHIDTMRYIATTKKPFEANTPHHFAFRGADDTTYVLSAVLAAKLAKKVGIETYVLQMMLNTPRYTSGVQDVAKVRAALHFIRALEDDSFRVILQPRAGLDYFAPDLEKAKAQLAAVSALMDDIEPDNPLSPAVIHVVSYSEAVHLATPGVINESVQLTQQALQTYRKRRAAGLIENIDTKTDVHERTRKLVKNVQTLLDAIEESIEDPYCAEGMYTIFAAGFMPTPYLWAEKEEFSYARKWQTIFLNGGVQVVDEEGQPVDALTIAEVAKTHLPEVAYQLNEKKKRNLYTFR